MQSHGPDGGDVRAVLDALRSIFRHLRGPGGGSARRSTAQLFVLSVLAEDGPLSVTGLAERTHTHQSSVSVVAKRLVADGLLRRVRSASDGRRLELSITSRGRSLLARRAPAPQADLVRAVAGLRPDRRRALALALGEILGALGASRRAPPMFFEEGRRSRRDRGRR